MIPREILAALRTIEIHTARLANEQLSGTYKSSFKGQGLAFREVRPYQAGDDVRTIDWNVSARMNEAFVKVFTEEREMTVMLAVDLSASERFGTQRAPKARVASEVAALVAFSAIRNNDRIGLILCTSKVERIVPPKKGEKHVMRVVREILGFEAPQAAGARHTEDRFVRKTPKKKNQANDRFPAAPYPNLGAQTDLKAALEALVHVARRRSVAFVVSDFLAAGYERALSLASAKHDVIPVVLVDKRDFELPDVGLATFEDLESGEMIVVDTSDKHVRAHFEREMKRIRDARRQVFNKLGLDSVEVDTGGSFVRPIRDLFARRARRVRVRWRVFLNMGLRPKPRERDTDASTRRSPALCLALACLAFFFTFLLGAKARADDAGAGDSTYGCVESVPKGAERPVVADVFPGRGTSGYATALAISVRHGKGEKVLPSGLDMSNAVEAKKVLKQAGFAVPDQDGGSGARIWSDPEDPTTGKAVTHFELPLVLLPPNPGRNVMYLPPLPVAVARANGEIATMCTHPHSILVEDPTANTPAAMPKLNPPPVPQREEWTSLKKAVLWGALGLVIGAILGLFIWRQVNKPKPVPPPPPPRPPWEVALEELESVRHAGLLEGERFGEHFDRTSDALRRYLGARFGFDGLESTTDEILSALKKQATGFIRLEDPEPGKVAFAPGMAFSRIANFLREADLVKFANLTPTPEQCALSITTGESIVRGTMPFSAGGNSPEEVDAPVAADPVAAAGLRSPVVAKKPERSPYEPPEPSEPAQPVVDPPRDDEGDKS